MFYVVPRAKLPGTIHSGCSFPYRFFTVSGMVSDHLQNACHVVYITASPYIFVVSRSSRSLVQ